MRAMLHLEVRSLTPALPAVAVMLVLSLAAGLIHQELGAAIRVVFTAIATAMLIDRLFAFEPTSRRPNTLVGTLPVTRHQVTTSRYALAVLVIALAAVFITLTLPALPKGGWGTGGGLGERIAVAMLFGALLLLDLAVAGPLSSRGGFGMLGQFMRMIPFFGLIIILIAMPGTRREALFALLLRAPVASGAVCLAAGMLLASASYLLSVRWFARRDL